MRSKNIICGFCNTFCSKSEVIVLRDNNLYYANRIKCPSCNYTSYELTENICGIESPEKFDYFLPKAIDISK